MAGIFSHQKQSATTPTYTKLSLQTSALGLCIPIAWGRFRCGVNLIDYVDFKSHSQKKKGKGGSSKGSGQKTYSASIALALCEGPIQNVRLVYYNQSTTPYTSLGFIHFYGDAGQTAWSYMTSHHSDHALAYAGTAYMAAADYDLGSAATLPQHNFEIDGGISNNCAAPNGDANPGDIIPDLLTNPQYSLALSSSLLDATSLAHYRTYCEAQGLWLSPVLKAQEQVTTILQRWAQLTNSWIFWTGSAIKFVPLGDCNIVANGVTYLPECQPVYDLTYDDFIVSGSEDMPVTLERSDPADGYNKVVVHISDRQHEYNNTPIDWIDQASFDAYGLLQSQEVQADEVCEGSIGAVMAQLIGLRTVYVRNHYKFKLPYGYVLLEPGDTVSITEPHIGLDRLLVRITEIEENEDGLLAVTAEEFAFDCNAGSGVFAQSAAYTQGASYTPLPNIGLADPGNVNPPPMIMEPNTVLLNGMAPQVWVGASGGASWGGADVYLSFDGITFSEIGTINAPSPQGVLTAVLPAHADPDTVDTLSVDLASSSTVLQSTASYADADAGRTLCLVGSELLAYGSLTPGGTEFAADMTYLRRGLYNTAVASHDIGTAFTRIDLVNATLAYTLPSQYVGQTLYFKFASFNLFNNVTQDISSLPIYVYTPTGTGIVPPPSTPALLTLVNGDTPPGIVHDDAGVPVYVTDMVASTSGGTTSGGGTIGGGTIGGGGGTGGGTGGSGGGGTVVSGGGSTGGGSSGVTVPMLNHSLYYLSGVDPANVAAQAATFDVKIVDPTSDGGAGNTFWSSAQVTSMRGSGGPVLAYFDMGGAETFRYYYASAHAAGILSTTVNSWGEYSVQYWSTTWLNIAKAWADKAIAAGFDGIYLDVADCYTDSWSRSHAPAAGGYAAGSDAAAGYLEIQFIAALRSYVQSVVPTFQVWQNAGEGLSDTATYGSSPRFVDVIDGALREEVIYQYGGSTVAPVSDTTDDYTNLARIVAAGKPVTLVEYVGAGGVTISGGTSDGVSVGSGTTNAIHLIRSKTAAWNMGFYVSVADYPNPTLGVVDTEGITTP